ncbi:ammonium transporter [Phenylobacterium sp.]|uniref:ammonium transporter n=1 Tax=Phenylobacterium sp. TaxID=1871053 RepID=UPI002731321D|nr:ammonium transporter [Phenylobacterium sp.]MDP1600679.1 ammonium transporter [Phenylobacterium sp.]
MKKSGLQKLTGLALAAMLAGGILAPAAAFAQDAAAPAAVAAEASPATATPETPAPMAAEAAPAPAAEEEAAKPALDTGDTSWVLTSTALVLMMTIPGLALFYGGMVRRKNVIATVAQSFAITAVISVVWMIAGYSLSFSANDNEGLNKVIGGFSNAFLSGVTMESTNSLAATIPESVFVMFQMTFAIITPALIAGAYAERMKFSAVLVFTVLWSLLVYAPTAHAVWGGGFLGGAGVLDFAGGTVVHINAGVAGLICALVLGRRKGYGTDNMAPHNLVLTMIGASLLWVGWFGFNAGSAVGSNALAGIAMLNTQVATAAAAIAWMVIEWVERKKPGMLGLASGAVAGLVAITPAAGFVNPQGALIIGLLGGAGGYFGAVWLKRLLKYDDSLDAFGVHGIAGIIGALLTGVLADPAVNSLGEGASLMTQLYGVAITIAYASIGTFIILMIVKYTVGLRVSEEAEVEGLDLSQHGEALHD